MSPALVAACLLAGCGGQVPAPDTAGLPERVVGVLDRRCASCHGRVPGHDAAPARFLSWPVDPSGRIPPGGWAETAARLLGCMGGAGDLDTRLVRAPLGARLGGVSHPEVFDRLDDPDLATLRDFARAGAREPDEAPGPAGRIFAEEVVPVLVRRGCFGSNCHGTMAANELKLDPGIPAFPARFTPAIHAANRKAALGIRQAMFDPAGDPRRARLLVKTLPLEEGGVLHKGGNALLSVADPDYQTLLRWLRAEAAEGRADAGGAAAAGGLVFVRRPRSTPQRLFEDTGFLPGGDLVWREDGREVNLTAGLHPAGPADVRAPAVSLDGRRVAVALRPGPDAPFDLWELELPGGRARRLTFSPGPGIHFLDPLYVPSLAHPDREALVLVSNRDGGDCETGPAALVGEAEAGGLDHLVDHQRTEAPGRFTGARIRFLAGAAAGAERTVEAHAEGRLGFDRPLPVAVDSTTRYALDVPPRRGPCFAAYRLEAAEPGREREAFEAMSRMTWMPTQIRRPTLLSSGEVAFTSLRTGIQAGIPYFHGALWRTRLDGSAFHPHGANRNAFPVVSDSVELVDGLEARIGRSPDSWWGGVLLLADHALGIAIEPDSPFDRWDHPLDGIDLFYGNADHPFDPVPNPSSGPRYIAPWIPLDPEARPAGRTPRAWRDPAASPDGGILVAVTKGPVDLDDPGAAPDFDIVRVTPDPAWQAARGFRREPPRPESELGALRSPVLAPLAEQGYRVGRLRIEPVVAGPESELWPRPVVRRRRRADPLAPVRVDPEIDGLVAPEGRGLLHVLDFAVIEALFEDTAPRGVRHLRSGTCPGCGIEHAPVAGVRVIAGPGPGGAPPGVLGEVPLHPDGSVAALLPARTPLRVQALDRAGLAISELPQWLYLQPGEKRELSIDRRIYPQACGSCHGALTGRPEDVLARVDAVTRASRTLAVAARPCPDAPTASPSGFAATVAPVLAAHCGSCHAGPAPAGGLDLLGPGAAAGLGRRDPPGTLSGASRWLGAARDPRSHGDLPDGALTALARWIDTGYPP